MGGSSEEHVNTQSSPDDIAAKENREFWQNIVDTATDDDSDASRSLDDDEAAKQITVDMSRSLDDEAAKQNTIDTTRFSDDEAPKNNREFWQGIELRKPFL